MFAVKTIYLEANYNSISKLLSSLYKYKTGAFFIETKMYQSKKSLTFIN